MKKYYSPPFPFKNPHVNTIYSALMRKIPSIHFKRERIATLDHDFIDLAFSSVNSKTLVLIVHGLEGSSQSSYVRRFTHTFNEINWNVCAMNQRSCSGELNSSFSAYHSGKTDDLELVVQYLKNIKKYDTIALLGFSLGGNLVLKYVGETQHSFIKCASGVSVPCDLKGSSIKMSTVSNKIYFNNIIRSLKEKLRQKILLFPEKGISKKDIENIKTFHDFDDLYTAPFHGFKSADDYYQKNSCRHFFEKITIPSLLLNALDDPFLSESCFPYKEIEKSPSVTFEVTKYGGHVGFYDQPRGWHEQRVVSFFKKYLPNL